METKLWKMHEKIDEKTIKEAAKLLRQGEVVAFPTETVYGLGADATNEQAIKKIFAAKGRPSDNPLIVHVATKEQLQALVQAYEPYVDKLISNFSPGPITYVLKNKGGVAKSVTANLDTVGVRIPNNEIALALLQACALPIAAPSANTSGKPSPTKGMHVYDDLQGRIAAIIDGPSAAIGLESTVIDCTGKVPQILRVGSITKEDIEEVVGTVDVINQRQVTEKPKSPGLKYKHYQPEVPLILVTKNEQLQTIIDEQIQAGKKVGALVSNHTAKHIRANVLIRLGDTEAMMAKKLYDILRSLRSDELDVVVCESLPTEQVGLAVMDRLKRAASLII